MLIPANYRKILALASNSLKLLRVRLQHPVQGRIAQGGIFNCVQLDEYPDHDCSGIVINARCDLEHGKTEHVNFLPVVPIDAWIAIDLPKILAARQKKSARNTFENELRKKKVSDESIRLFSHEILIEKRFEGEAKEEMYEKLNLLKVVENVSRGTGDPSEHKLILKVNKNQIKSVLTDLVKQRCAGYYFLNSVDVSKMDECGHVVIMRSMRVIPSKILGQVAEGIDYETHDIRIPPILVTEKSPICLFTGVLRSPDVEHLMQSFASQFTRIGLEDQSSGSIEKIAEIANIMIT